MKPTQNERLLDYLSRHHGPTAMNIINALALPNYRARVSELRQAGHVIEVVRDKHGLNRYWLRTKPVQLQAFGAPSRVVADGTTGMVRADAYGPRRGL